jgi:hypothetical protein
MKENKFVVSLVDMEMLNEQLKLDMEKLNEQFKLYMEKLNKQLKLDMEKLNEQLKLEFTSKEFIIGKFHNDVEELQKELAVKES